MSPAQTVAAEETFGDIIFDLSFAADMADDIGEPGDGNLYIRAIAEIRRLRALLPVWRRLDDVPGSMTPVFTAVIAVRDEDDQELGCNLVNAIYQFAKGRWTDEDTDKPLATVEGDTYYWLSEADLLSSLPAVQL